MPSSLLETVLAYGDLPFLTLFFRSWDPSTIFLLGRLSYRLRSIVYFYCQSTWSVPVFLSRWFTDPDTVLSLLDSAPGIICGPSVLQFFDRAPLTETCLDICVNFGGLSDIGRFLASQQYRFRPPSGSQVRDFDLAILTEAAHLPNDHFSAYGDRTLSQEDHGSRPLKFVRTSRGPPGSSRVRVIVVHLVRCELHRFVFAMHSTAFMNYIDGKNAISTFPRSAFIKRLSFIACQERVPGTDEVMTELGAWLASYGQSYAPMKIIGDSHVVYRDLEHGSRRIGDGHCWVVPCTTNLNAMPVMRAVDGPGFEVLDWKYGVTRHGSYLRVGEPFIWRAWSYARELGSRACDKQSL